MRGEYEGRLRNMTVRGRENVKGGGVTWNKVERSYEGRRGGGGGGGRVKVRGEWERLCICIPLPLSLSLSLSYQVAERGRQAERV